jgi:Na+/phosphate symporter
MEIFFINNSSLMFIVLSLSAFFTTSAGKFILVIFFALAGFVAFYTRKYFRKRNREESEEDLEDSAETEEVEKIMKKCITHLTETLTQTENLYNLGISSFLNEDLNTLKNCMNLKNDLSNSLNKGKNKAFRTASFFENSLHSGHYYVELKDYQLRIVNAVSLLLQPMYEHLNNSHKPFTKAQKEELTKLGKEVSAFFGLSASIIKSIRFKQMENLVKMHVEINKLLENLEVAQIKRIKTNQVNTRNSILFLNTLSETKNMLNQSANLLKAYQNLLAV